MQTITSILVLIVGLLIRLAIPIALTALLIFFLRKLDARWQAEAELPQLDERTTECWKIKNCPPEQLNNCVAYQATLPCWQVKRLPNGYLREECLSCEIFIEAPMPALKNEPGRI